MDATDQARTRSELLDELHQLHRRVAELETAARHDLPLAALIEFAPDALLLTQPDGKIVLANSQTEVLFGWTRQELLGRTVEVLMPKQYRDHHVHLRGEYLAAPSVRPIEGAPTLYGRRKDGSEFPVEIGLSPIKTETGMMVAASIRDITRRKQAEQELSEKEEQLRLLLHSTAEGIYALDLEGKCTFFNPACARLLGYDTSANLLGKNMHDLMHHTRPDGTACPRQQCRIWNAYRHGKETHADEELFWRADGSSFPAEYWSYPLYRDDEVTGSVVTFIDITERRRAEEQLKQRHDELAHDSRLSTIGEMAAELAHELNQPLYAIKNYAGGCIRRMQAGGPITEELIESVQQITEVAQRAAEVIRRIRGLVSKGESKRTAADVNKLVDDVVRICAGDARRRGVAVAVNPDQSLPDVFVDPIQIQQVILNLLRNALEAMDTDQAETRELTIQTSPAGPDQVEVALRDTGPRLSLQSVDQMFEPFFTTKQEGMGLGLAISRTIIESHEGRLWATVNPDRGATFRFTVPIDDGNEDR